MVTWHRSPRALIVEVLVLAALPRIAYSDIFDVRAGACAGAGACCLRSQEVSTALPLKV